MSRRPQPAALVQRRLDIGDIIVVGDPADPADHCRVVAFAPATGQVYVRTSRGHMSRMSVFAALANRLPRPDRGELP